MSIRIQGRGNIYSNIFGKAYSQKKCAQNGFSEEEYSTRKAEYSQRLQDKNSKSVVDQAISYANQLKTSRTKSKDASLQKKKLQYSFKKISSQIVRCKNSSSARRAVQAAKHEVMRLKRLKGNGEYDDEELQLAIDHAKAMEKIARKKANHLEQEEMIERTGKGAAAALEEIEEKQDDEKEEDIDDEIPEELLEEAAAYDEDSQDFEDLEVTIPDDIRQEIASYQYELQLRMQELTENSEYIAESVSDSASELTDELSEEMSEMMEDMGLDELAETMYAPDPNMSEDDLKLLKIKHRGKELKEIAEADKEYLKGIIEHEKAKAESSAALVGNQSSSPKTFSDNAPEIKPVISMPGYTGGRMEAPTVNGSFSVSV